ncbi:MAG TPA: hypothetical protein VLF93_03840 [Candidatus Saccharimonadales bacterium]|nr:hypothetical protein [Candidatus Saccharimonadales bacterium]
MITKGTTIFEEKSEVTEPKRKRQDNFLALSRDEYRKVIQEAYKEGLKDAQKENQKKQVAAMQNPEASAIKAAQNKQVAQEEENKKKFENIADRREIELLRVKSLFPFDFFPDTVVIDTTKISISRKQFFATEYVVTIPLKDLSDATLQTASFMGSIIIKYMPQSNSPGMNEPVDIKITKLSRGDAIRMKNILKGILVANAEEIDIAQLEPKDIVNVIEKFGHSEGVV